MPKSEAELQEQLAELEYRVNTFSRETASDIANREAMRQAALSPPPPAAPKGPPTMKLSEWNALSRAASRSERDRLVYASAYEEIKARRLLLVND